MTLLQLKYAVVISNSSSMREAAGKLFLSQPALSASMRELEEELGFKVFNRNNRGISVTVNGLEFLEYAKQAVSQYDMVEERYGPSQRDRIKFSVSMQHYVFAVNAFMETVKKSSPDRYTFAVHETRTDEVLGDVRDSKSEIGVLSFSRTNEKLIRKLFREYHLKFYPLMQRETFIYVWENHPLADRTELSIEQLREYPCVTFEQGRKKDFYLKEEALGDYDYQKVIKANDRATSMEIIAGLNGYSVGTGSASDSALYKGLVCIKLKEEDPLTIGYILKDGYNLSPIGEQYIAELKKQST